MFESQPLRWFASLTFPSLQEGFTNSLLQNNAGSDENWNAR